jgi:dTMP kinase
MFITFEGIDGSGKTTAARALRNYLASTGYNVEITHAPGGTLVGEEIRAILRSSHWQLGSVTKLLLALASHAELVQAVIQPSLAKGIVICDGFVDSTYAYQAADQQLHAELIVQFEQFIVADCMPDITFLLDVDPAIARERTSIQSSRYEYYEYKDGELLFMKRLRRAYLEHAVADSWRFVIVDAGQSLDDVMDTVKEYTRRALAEQVVDSMKYLSQSKLYGKRER